MQELVESKVELMLMQLLLECNDSGKSALQCSMAARDGFIYSLMWSTGLRGINACEVCCQDFWLPATDASPSVPALGAIAPCFNLTVGSTVTIVPQQIKTNIDANSKGIQLTVQTNELLDPLRWLNLLMLTSSKAGTPISCALERPLNRQGMGYQEQHLTCQSLHSRMVGLLQHLGVYEQESMHSFRRGRAIQQNSPGISHEAIMDRMLITTREVLQTNYLTCGRHDSGVQRVSRCVRPRPDPQSLQAPPWLTALLPPVLGCPVAHSI